MPGEELAASAAGAGASLLGTYANVGLNLAQNRWQRKHELKMYEMQRRDALADWERVNAYNHPAQQRARLKEAGLNPNLVYGKGADVTASPMRGVSYDGKAQIPVQIDTAAIGRAFQGIQMAQRMDADIRLKEQQELLLMAQTAKEWGLVDKNGQQFKEMKETYDIRKATMEAEQFMAQAGVEGKNLENMKIALTMAQISQDMDIAEERRIPILNQLAMQTELGRQAYELNLREDQRKQLASQADLRLAAIQYQKILLDNLLTKEKTLTEGAQRQKIYQERINLQQQLENLEANRQLILSKKEYTDLQSIYQNSKNDYQGVENLLRSFTVMSSAYQPPAQAKTKTRK